MFDQIPTVRPPLSEDPRDGNQLLLGCTICGFLGRCGGLGSSTNNWDCFGSCKSSCSSGCPYACPKSELTQFINRISELSPYGFQLEDIVAEGRPPFRSLQQHVPRIDHGSKRVSRLRSPLVAIPLRFLVNFRKGTLVHKTNAALASHFGIARATRVLGVGVAKDFELEALWGSRTHISRISRNLRSIGVVGVTAPNFSSFENGPRTEDMANFVRQALLWRSFVDAGMPAAYHFNGRTAADVRNIAKFIERNPSLYWISVEFDTGAKRKEVLDQLVADLAALPHLVGRPLGLISIGGMQALDHVKRSYERLCFVDGDPFFKMFNRRVLDIDSSGALVETAAPRSGQLDQTLARNIAARRFQVSRVIIGGREG